MLSTLLFATVMNLKFDYPDSHKGNHVDVYHNIAVSDPYRWLEKPITDQQVKTWVDEQNQVTFNFLNNIDGRDRLFEELNKRINYERYTVPSIEGGKVFYSHNTGLQNQNVLYVAENLNAEPKVLLDPNKLSEDGTIALSATDVSLDGKTLLYGLSKSGSDWVEWHVKNIETGEDYPDVVQWSKFGVGMLDHTGKGFYYLKFPEPKDANTFVAENKSPQIFHHIIGTEQKNDTLIYELPDQPDHLIWPGLSEDRKVMYLYISIPGEIQPKVLLKELTWEDSDFITIYDSTEAEFVPIYQQNDSVWVYTTQDAPKGKIIQIHYRKRLAPRVIVPETEHTMQSASVIGGKIIGQYMKDVKSSLIAYPLQGGEGQEINLPGLGTVGTLSGRSDSPTAFFDYQDMTSPSSIYQLKMSDLSTTVYRAPKLPFDYSKYEAKQVFFDSKDGTKVPMFIVHKKGIELDGTNPTLLYAYGGFNVSNQPWFSTSRTVWMDMGGIWVLANIRGGGEYGDEWHQSAIKTKRQNAYDDFIAAAEYLIDNKYTSKSKLAIQGGSNGGLLVGACMTQRPDLYAVAIPEVGVMDMLRFNQFTIGKAWESDYGSPDNLDEFLALWRISPYHNLRNNTVYPATLVTTADTDDRVVPAHSFKFAARLQEAHVGESPVMIRIETSAGHGGGKPIYKIMEEVRDVYSFILENMGEKIPASF